jgi:hypothetical protein
MAKMDFRLEMQPRAFEAKLLHADRLLLIGSCFTEQIGAKLDYHLFSTLQNPNGILFNPVSIAQAVSGYIHHRQYTAQDLFCQQDIWGSWDHHTRFSHTNPQVCLEAINTSQSNAHSFLKKADWMLITLGSSFVYELPDKGVVANCHKVSTDKFSKRLLSSSEIIRLLQQMMDELMAFNPSVKIIFTISPVRHLRDGFVENNQSKAQLITAVHELVHQNSNAFYFPAYELIIDDLRDYRFYAEDMVHPNYLATNYVWEKFSTSCIDGKSREIFKDIEQIHNALRHRPMHPNSLEHKKFRQKTFTTIKILSDKLPELNWDEELLFFKD